MTDGKSEVQPTSLLSGVTRIVLQGARARGAPVAKFVVTKHPEMKAIWR